MDPQLEMEGGGREADLLILLTADGKVTFTHGVTRDNLYKKMMYYVHVVKVTDVTCEKFVQIYVGHFAQLYDE